MSKEHKIDWDSLRNELNGMVDDLGLDFNEEESYEDYDYSEYIPKKEEKTTAYVAVGEEKPEISEEILMKDFITDQDVYENSSILYPEKKVYRSMILEIFTPEQLLYLSRLSETFSISNNQKISIIKEKLTEWNIDYAPLGGGTNRFGFMIDGYALKIACDKDGKIDNKREFKYSQNLQPYVVKCYEISPDGLMGVFEYVEIFTMDDYVNNQDKMRTILEDIAKSFLIGDVGVTSKNYVNWGFRENGEPVILDFAYIYAVSYKQFKCQCPSHALLYYDKDFVKLICPACGKGYRFEDIRQRISRQDQDEEIGDITTQGYILTAPEQEKKFNVNFVLGAYDAVFRKLIKMKKKADKRLIQQKEKERDDDEIIEFDELLAKIRSGELL